MKTVRIFLSSPGDVAAERALARGVIADLQKRYTGSFLLQPVFWEDLPLGSDVSFQEGIDVVLSAEGGIDIAVFILWSRLGSPLGRRVRKTDGSDYLSGTEREWDLMLRAREESGGTRPDIFTYIRDDQNGFIESQRGKDQPQLLEMVLQQGKVKNFVAEHFTDRNSGTNVRAYFSFREPITFAHRLRTHLRAWLDQRLVDADQAAVVWHPAEQGSPFRGLEAFEYEHAPLFFGREQEICDLQIRLRQQAEAGCAFVLLVGASGSGKSSLARAGVAPAVAQYDREDEAAEWRRAIFTPEASRDDLLLGLVRALAAPEALPELAKENLAELADGFARDPELTFRFKLRPLFAGNRRRLLLIFDQVEELFTYDEISAEARGLLGAALGVLARSGSVWLLGTVRSDYYAKFQAVPELLALKGEGAHVDLPPPAVAELQRIITQPARAAGLRFEENERGERLDARLLADAAAHPEALPLLEFCLDALYQQQAAHGNDGLLRWSDYEAMKTAAAEPSNTAAATTANAPAESGLAGALVSQAEAALASLPAEHQRQCLAAIFSKLLDLSATLERETPVRRTAPESELIRNPYQRGNDPGELSGARAFLQAFTAKRLLVSGVAGGSGQEPQRTYTVAHEALLRNWWRLRRLQAEQAEYFRIRRQVERAQSDWQAAGQDDSFLLAEGLPLQLARKLAADAPELLTSPLADYIAHSSQRVDRLRRRRRRLTTAVIAGLTLLALGTGIGAWFGFRGEQEAQRQAAIAQERTSVAQEQTGIAQTKTKEAQERATEVGRQIAMAKAQIHQALVSDFATAHNLLRKGNWREGLTYLGRAQRYDDPDNRLVSASLWAEIVYGRGDRDTLPEHQLTHGDAVWCVAYSPDGTRIVTASADKTARQWVAATGKPFGEPLRHTEAVNSAAYSPDGTRIVTACDDHTARQWEAATGKPLGEPLRHEGRVHRAVYSPDGTRIVTGCDDGTARQWVAATGKPFGEPLRHGGAILSVAYSPDGKRIVTGSTDKTGCQWDAVTCKRLGALLQHESYVWSTVYSPDGTRILTASIDKTVQQWDVARGTRLGAPMHHDDRVRSAAYSADGTRIITASWDHTARQWETTTGTPLGEPLRHGNEVTSAAYSPDGVHLAIACADGVVQQWDACIGQLAGEQLRHEEVVNGVDYSPDGTRIVTACNDNRAWQWVVATGRSLGDPLHHENAVRPMLKPKPGANAEEIAAVFLFDALASIIPLDRVFSANYSPDGSRVVSAGMDCAARQWEAATGKPFGEPLRHTEAVNSAAYSPDGTRIVTACDDHTARQWEAATGKPLGEPLRHEGRVHRAVYSPDGTRIVTGCDDGTARQWEAATGKPFGEPLRHTEAVNSAAYSPDGTRIVTACDDHTARQWEAATGKPLGEPLRHEGRVHRAVYSPDGTRIVTGCDDGTARQWVAATGKPFGEPLRHTEAVNSAAYSPDGTRIVTACDDHTARQWEYFLPSTPSPDWLNDFVQMLSGLRFDDDGELQTIKLTDRQILRRDLQARLSTSAWSPDGWERLAHWSFASPVARSYTPNSKQSAPDIAGREIDSGQQPRVEAALRLVPNLPLAHLALAAFKDYAYCADFLRRYELARLPPGDATMRLRAVAMLRTQQQPRLALRALEEIAATTPPTVEWLANLTMTRWLAGDKDGAVRDGQRLLALDPGFADPARARAFSLSEADAAALTAAIAETLRRHPELAPKPSPGP